jgi:tetratricopeptide (TPR) repeat protein
VLAYLRGQPKLPEALRQAALTMVEQYRLDPAALNRASRAVVRKPAATEAAYRHALRQAEEACRLEPADGLYLSTLGLAQYRLGRYQAAVETLARSEQLQGAPTDGAPPAALAFLAMARHQLGQKEQAQAALARLRAALAQPRWANDPESAAFCKEAEGLLGAVPAAPK